MTIECPYFPHWRCDTIQAWIEQTQQNGKHEQKQALQSYVTAWKSSLLSLRSKKPWTPEQEQCGKLLLSTLVNDFSPYNFDTDLLRTLWLVSRQLLEVNQPSLYQCLLEHTHTLGYTTALKKSQHLGLDDTRTICAIGRNILSQCKSSWMSLEHSDSNTHIKLVQQRSSISNPILRQPEEVWLALICTANQEWQTMYRPWWDTWLALNEQSARNKLSGQDILDIFDTFSSLLPNSKQSMETVDYAQAMYP